MHHRCHEYSYRDEYLSATPIEKLGSSLHLSIIRRPGESHRPLNKSCMHTHTHTEKFGSRRRETEWKTTKSYVCVRVLLRSSAFWVGKDWEVSSSILKTGVCEQHDRGYISVCEDLCTHLCFLTVCLRVRIKVFYF